jgi:ferric-dicitrate binding protein FerR (iron transport regulator)
MVKNQQMRWSQQGAHWLLQVRTRVLNDELRETFQQWYPKFMQQEQPLKKAA